MTVETSFGRWLQRRRKALDLTQEELAQRVACAAETLRKIEADVRRPSRQIAERLAEALEIPESDRAAFVRAARAELAVDRLAHPTQDLPQIAFVLHPSPTKPIANLPAPLTTFIGREKEQAEVIKLITRHRLVTLTGPGGVGKTRLSIKVGEKVMENYDHGVWFVELAAILDPLLVPRTTAIAVGLRDEPQRPVIDMLSDYLREKQTLIILDNCEHLLDACAQLADTLLKRCPGLKILATSREIIGILGEAIYLVPSLDLPDMQTWLEKLREYTSIRLFEERAQLIQFDFSLTLDNVKQVTQICRQLDGIPLAIELAAAKIGTLSTEQIAKQLEESFNILTGGNRTALPRHQTLRASIDWSWGLLTESEQRLIRQLSIFAGGWTLEAAQAICGGNVLELSHSLIKKSLLGMNHDASSGARYSFHEIVRQYANERLVEAGESEALRDRHLEYFLTLAEVAEPHLLRSEQTEWLPVLEADYENLRLAFQWSLRKESRVAALRLCAALGWFWDIRCYWLEGANWLRQALTIPPPLEEKTTKIARVRSLNMDALFQWRLANIEQMYLSAEASLALALENSDERDIAIAKYFLAAALRQRGEEDDKMLSLLEQSFSAFQELNDLFWKARSFTDLVFFLVAHSKLKYSEVILQCMEFAREAGERVILAGLLEDYADWLCRINEVDKAIEYAEESEMLYKQVGAEKMSLNPFLFADIAWHNGDYRQARSIYLQLYERCRLLGDKGFQSNSAGQLGILTMEEGNLDQAQVYLEEALLIEQEAGWKPWVAFYLVELGNLFYLRGKIEKCKHNFRECLSLRDYFTAAHKSYLLMTMLGSFYLKKPDSSARLLGVIHNPERENDFPRTPIDKRYCSRAEAYAREVLGNVTFESEFTEGQKMSVDEGLDLALKIVEEI